jgi:hypothetical protein
MLRRSKEIVGLVFSIQDALSICAGIIIFCALSLRGKRVRLKRLFLLAFYRKIRQTFNISHLIKYVCHELLHCVRRELYNMYLT